MNSRSCRTMCFILALLLGRLYDMPLGFGYLLRFPTGRRWRG